MSAFWLLALALQAILIGIDEFAFHHERGLPAWEVLGHPVDTLSLFLCLLMTLTVSYSKTHLFWYSGLAILSCLLVTKDEFIHQKHCKPLEHWLHALLFILHPLALIAFALFWETTSSSSPDANLWCHQALTIEALGVAFFMLYQVVYWSLIRPRSHHAARQ